ncbi:MAG TPA: endonuclease Q family protein, partial [Nitrososphaerales archaeon]|nr:endonuclease Q family protein [Nitrososphaerales archaeon]
MRVFADLQLHSKYALATSRDMDLEHLAEGGRRKGLNLLGTGDFTHPKWLSEIKSKLVPIDGSGLYQYRNMNWMLSGEVSTVYEQGGRKRKVHHLVYAHDFEVVDQVSEVLGKYGKLSSDGRPILTGIDSSGLVESLTSISDRVVVIPAHAWTPWFGALGSKSGFDTLAECYGDQAHKIFALETGLSCYDELTDVLTESGWKRFSE